MKSGLHGVFRLVGQFKESIRKDMTEQILIVLIEAILNIPMGNVLILLDIIYLQQEMIWVIFVFLNTLV